MTLTELVRATEKRLRAVVDSPGEARDMTRMIFQHLRGWTPVDLIVNGSDEVSDFTSGQVDRIAARVQGGEPLQYVLGFARFYGNNYKVTPDVLIPRPETEGLVDRVVEYNGNAADRHVLDLGTGSGCIAISLARALPFSQVEAVDISEGALEVARENGRALKVHVDFHKADILALQPREDNYDIIVSNPPYIAVHEREDMDPRVYDHEPAGALFAPEGEPLKFYDAIGRYAIKSLKSKGLLALEINPLYASELAQMLKEYGFDPIDLQRDIHERMRYCLAVKP